MTMSAKVRSAILGLLVCPVLGSAQNFDNVQIRTIPVRGHLHAPGERREHRRLDR